MPQTRERKAEYEKEYIRRPEVAERRRKNFRKWREENNDHVNAMEAQRRLSKRAMILIGNARGRAHRCGLPFDLDGHVAELQARLDLGVCETSGIPFDLSPGRKWNSPSIDRVTPANGYTYDNVRLILFGLNCALGDWGEETLMKMATAMESLSRRRKRSSKRT